MCKQPVREKHLYSVRFREEFGRTLTREEIRLVHAFRGMDAKTQAAWLTLITSAMLAGQLAPEAGGVDAAGVDGDRDE